MKRSNWRSHLAGGPQSPVLRSWLTEPGSLTARCLQSSQRFGVRLLQFGKGKALADEAIDGGCDGALAWVREVELICDGRPVIFAHTTLAASRNGRLTRWMARLGSRSLGSLLFAYPGFSRGQIEFLRLDDRHPLYRKAAARYSLPRHLWARRSLHRLDGQQVLVTEVFLPDILGLG
ncbi:Chorismate pyruvate-lyase [bioreactor metagenome]|uniref:Chorismate pyruvate-lyase n=1 Tax=bioreactor metagenome TaxID=1076179 RepID=A0A645C6S0_9ZZZZ|nr:chorismate lyase [Dechloromonas sp. CZR5]MBL8403903.1 chorismate lyase [Dechloromonas sp.]